jgi:CBS domain-containing protein
MKDKDNDLSKEEVATLNAYKQPLDASTKFIPIWVKVSVALGLGTMVGWKRIVITVGEKIGKTHLTYGQGRLRNSSRRRPSPGPTCMVCRFRPPMSCHRCRGNDGGRRVRPAAIDDPQHRARMDLDAADGDDGVGGPLHSVRQSVLRLAAEEGGMRAVDVMIRDVVTVHPETDVADAIKLLAEHDVSALPVLDGAGHLVGMLSEADLIHRVEIGTEKHRPWWQEAVTGASTLAADFAKSHGEKVDEVMAPGVISVSEDTSLSEIAALFERKGIKASR